MTDTQQQSEAELIRQSQAGDRAAFGAIVKRYAGAAVGSAHLLLGSHSAGRCSRSARSC